MANENSRAEIDQLRQRLEEAEETLRAIRSGAVDALVVEGGDGERVYTLEGADRPYRLFVEQMQQAAITLNADGVIAYCNQRFADLLDRPHEQLTGTALRDFIAPGEKPFYDGLLKLGLAGTGEGEAQLQKAGGTLIPAFLTINALPPDTGVAVGVLVTDLTTQRRHEKLAAAVEALREADRRKDEFLAMLAHELRNPLTPIRYALQILQLNDGDAAEVKSMSEIMDRQVSQMVRLIDDLLDVSRISRGKIELRTGLVELALVVSHALEAARPACEGGGVRMTFTLPSDPIYLEGDPARLAQVVGNLLNNACKFTQDGGHVRVTVERESGQAVLRVRDTGIGISADQLLRIFEMFTQIDTSLERSQSGLGIGLTLVKNLVELHGGTIEARSAGIGHGSEFVVRLPLAAGPIQRELPPTWSGGEKAATPLRLLVVDDNRDSAKSLTMLLKISGHEVYVAYDGLEAVEAAATCRPDVILLDIGLPKINGFEAARLIRKEPWGRDVVIVALTGWGQPEDLIRSADAGFNSHMVKPVDYQALMKLLTEVQPTPV